MTDRSLHENVLYRRPRFDRLTDRPLHYIMLYRRPRLDRLADRPFLGATVVVVRFSGRK